jgi:hypothetical protein
MFAYLVSLYSVRSGLTILKNATIVINKLADLIERDADRLSESCSLSFPTFRQRTPKSLFAFQGLANEFNRLTCTVACSHREIPFQGELESLNSGKGVRMAKDFDLGDTVACLRYNAGKSRRLLID